MLEFLLVLASLVGLCAIALATVVVTPQIMIELGLWVLAVGLLIGIPTGLWYHVTLYRQLAPRVTLPPRWWRDPVAWHAQLSPSDFRPVRPWFLLGAAGFVLCCLGGAAAIIGLLVARLQE
ncbi:MAG: hypothetical protein Q8L74_14070 [Nitrospirota bacterium]|nr:hypothetical protein [Nitrospirota bacterium]MDP2383075.1 hypothetical protein [Nitrospirota bacterium]